MPSQDLIVETRLLSGLDYLDQGILIVGPDLIIRAANRAHQDIFGLPDGFATTGSDMRKVYTLSLIHI